MKLRVNLKSAISRCSAEVPKVVMGEPSVVLSLVAVGCMGVCSSLPFFCKLSVKGV